MELISKELLEDYERYVSQTDEDPFSSNTTIGFIEVLKAHYLIIDYFSSEYGEGIGGIGPRDIGLLYSALGRQFTGYDSHIKWKNEFELCATLFFGLIMDHPFHDANKRTAFLTLLFHLRKLNRKPDTKQKDFEILALRIAKKELNLYKNFNDFTDKKDREVLFIANFLRRNTKKIDKKEYIITYRDLDQILKRYNYGLINPNKNKIDLVRFEDKNKLKRIATIDFPSWGRQVCIRDIKQVRKLTELTQENGYDSDTFFHQSEPFAALIWQYQNPLKRLADK